MSPKKCVFLEDIDISITFEIWQWKFHTLTAFEYSLLFKMISYDIYRVIALNLKMLLLMPNTFLNYVLYREILFSFICKQKFLDNTFVSLFWWEK